MVTQSWTEGSGIISQTPVSSSRTTNFIITSKGYLSTKTTSSNDDVNEYLKNFSLGYTHKDSNNNEIAQQVTYWTKDLDFGVPSQTKKLFKVFITYKGNLANNYVSYAVDGENTDHYYFSIDSAGGTENQQPLEDKGSETNLQQLHVATLYPAVIAESEGWKSISLRIRYGGSGTSDGQGWSSDVEIQDISILYRARPIK